MGYFLIGIIVLCLGLLVLKHFAKANPADLAKLVRRFGGILSLIVAAFMAVTGRWIFAIPIAGFGLSLLGMRVPGFAPFAGTSRKSPGQTSTVRSRFVEMELDHDSGEMEGNVLDGRFEGQRLKSLSLGDLMDFMAEVETDEESLVLLQTYLDRRFPGWRETDDEAADIGGQKSIKMTRDEALSILGLEGRPPAAKIRAAHRNLMKKMHPDQGGSTYFATKLNEARDFLLNS